MEAQIEGGRAVGGTNRGGSPESTETVPRADLSSTRTMHASSGPTEPSAEFRLPAGFLQEIDSGLGANAPVGTFELL